MDKYLANKIAKEWNERFAGENDATTTTAEVVEEGNNRYHVSIYPAESADAEAFHREEELVLVTQFYNLSSFIFWNKYDKRIEAFMY